jgi:predicted transposase YbfD/YdcC
MPRNPNKSDWSGGLPACISSFSVIEDPRTGGNKLHHFGEVLFMAVSAMLCGMNCFSDIEDFCDLQIDWLRKWIKMPNGVPRAQTFSNIFAIIEPDLFNRCLAEHIGALHPALKRQIIAIDGKRLRGSHGPDTEACHVVSAWAAESGLTLAQEYVADKSNEITAIPHLIEVLALSGQIITLDAMGTHTHIAEAIIEKKADYILALKGNQGNLHKEAQDQFHFAIRNLDLAHSEGWSYDQRIEKSNGRIVTRSVTVNHRLDWMDTEIRGKWRNLSSLIHVETHTTQLDSDEIRREVRYYISSLDEPASAFQSHIRQHWSIENSCHWVLDTAFREDHNQTYIGHAAKNLGALRRIVLNLLKIDLTDTRSLPKKRRRAMLDLTYRDSLLSLA